MKNRNCILCGESGEKLLNKYGILEKNGSVIRFNNVICKNCGLVCINPQPEEDDYKNIYKKYEDSRHICQNENEVIKMMQEKPGEKKVEQIRDFLKDYLDDGSKILDIGCGFGQISNYFKNKYNYNIFAVEASELLSKVVREKFGVRVFCGHFNDFVKTNGDRFDLLILHHVFEHFIEPAEELIRFKNILAPNGVVYIEVPNVISFKKPVNQFFDYMHPCSYSPKTFKELIYKNGYKIIKVNKDKKYRLQVLVSPEDSNYEDLGNDAYWQKGGFLYTYLFVTKRKIFDIFKKI